MKSIKSLLLLTFTSLSAFMFAQKPIIVTEDSMAYGTNKYPGFVVSIPEVNYDRTLKEWTKELQSGTKSKVVNENGELSIFGAIIKDISPTPINIYSKLLNKDSLLNLLVSIELKKDQYVERATGDAELTATKAYLNKFAKNQYIDFIKDEVQVENKKLNDLKSDLNSLQNEKSKLQKSIQSNRTTINSERDNIVLQNTELTKLTAEILTQNNQFTSMEEGAAKEEKASYIKDLEKNKKKIMRDIESSENKVSKANNEITDAERDIPKNEANQDIAREKVSQQEAVLKRYEEKLNNVKAY
jgi:hypothetical protein